MFTVIIVQLFDNNQINLQCFPDLDAAEAHQNAAIDALTALYPEEDFFVSRPVGLGYASVSTGTPEGTFKTWMVIKTDRKKWS
ncbi:hypothetical protein [Gilvimarinus chinensis]|uniref:hypothetical protein n=1 Tax=Gilvimarinus chinensis TaxID=396005 RepID=UPI00036C31F1|nr:hypothetical protein [Gilvimarinus chinensis]